jgi:hypothetical protein
MIYFEKGELNDMGFKTGSYVINGQKDWICECCGQTIFTGSKQFIRVKESDEVFYTKAGEQYRKNYYTRWHLKCALGIVNLNSYEKRILGTYFIGLHEAQEAQQGQENSQKVSECA